MDSFTLTSCKKCIELHKTKEIEIFDKRTLKRRKCGTCTNICTHDYRYNHFFMKMHCIICGKTDDKPIDQNNKEYIKQVAKQVSNNKNRVRKNNS